MRYDSGQFREFDGLDNRKAVMDMFDRLGHGASEEVACARRACFVRNLLAVASSPVAQGKALKARISPMSPTSAYFAFVGMTGVLGVDITQAAVALDRQVAKVNP